MFLTSPDCRPKDGSLLQLEPETHRESATSYHTSAWRSRAWHFCGMPTSCLWQILQEFWRLSIGGRGQCLAAPEEMWAIEQVRPDFKPWFCHIQAV